MGLMLCLTILTGSLSGCRMREPEEVTFVSAIGVDIGQKQPYKITFQGIATSKIKGGESSSGEESIYNVAVEGSDFYDAVELAESFLADKLNFAQTKLLVFSSAIAQRDLKTQIDLFARNNDIRSDAYLAIAKDEAYDYLNAVKPILTTNPSKYYDMMFGDKNEEYIPVNKLNDIYSNLVAHDRQSVLPLVAVNPNNLKPKKEEQKENSSDEKNSENNTDADMGAFSAQGGEKDKQDDDSEQLTAGELSREGQNKSDILGGAVINDAGKMVGKLTAAETKYYNIVEGGFDKSIFSMDTGKDRHVAARLNEARAPRYRVKMEGDIPTIDVSLYLTLDYLSLVGAVEQDIKNGRLEKHIQKNLEKNLTKLLYKTSREYNCDIWGFYRHIFKNYTDYNALEKVKWEKLYPNANFRVHVLVTQKRSGPLIHFADNR